MTLSLDHPDKRTCLQVHLDAGEHRYIFRMPFDSENRLDNTAALMRSASMMVDNPQLNFDPYMLAMAGDLILGCGDLDEHYVEI